MKKVYECGKCSFLFNPKKPIPDTCPKCGKLLNKKLFPILTYKCIECSAVLDNKMSYCPSCGRKLIPEDEIIASKKEEKTPLLKTLANKIKENKGNSKKESKTFKWVGLSVSLVILISLVVLFVIPVSYPITVGYTVQEPYDAQEAYTVDVPYEVTVPYQESIPYTDVEEIKGEELNYEIIGEKNPKPQVNHKWIIWPVLSNVYYDVTIQLKNTDISGGTFTLDGQFTDGQDKTFSDGKRKESRNLQPGEVYGFNFKYDSSKEQDVKFHYTVSAGETTYQQVTKYKTETKSRTETKFRTETRYRTVTKYRDVPKERTEYGKANLWKIWTNKVSYYRRE